MKSVFGARSVSEQVSAIRQGSTSAMALAAQVRAEIESREPDLAAWTALSDTVTTQAQTQQDSAGHLPLRGISVGVKDLIDVAGLPTRAGSSTTSPHPVLTDADCVSRLRSLGVVVQGKTVTTEFGYFSPGPTRNPHSLTHTPGGSSSGSAAAVGSGSIPLALGTQTAGSLTRPAAFCGAAGLVLTQGSTSLAGVSGLSPSLDALGLLTRTTEDLRYVYSAYSGRDSEQASSSPINSAVVWSGSGLGELHPEMASLVEALPELLRASGLSVEALDWDDHVRTLAEDHHVVMAYEAAATLHTVAETHGDALSEPLRALVALGRSTREEDRTAALVRRDRSRELLSEMLRGRTMVAGPAALGPAPSGLAATGTPILSRPWQLLGCPVVTVPGARSSDGLPLGLQLIGQPGQEAALLDVAIRVEPMLRALPRAAV